MKIFTKEKDKLVHFEDINVGESFLFSKHGVSLHEDSKG